MMIKLNLKPGLKTLLTACCLLLSSLYVHAQTDPLIRARDLVAAQSYEQARPLYDKLYHQNPRDLDVYHEYLNLLLTLKDYKEAETLVTGQLRMRPQSPLLHIDLGRIYQESGKEKKAREQFDKALDNINGDDILTQQMATAFESLNLDAYALRTYERARDLLHNPFLYSGQLSRLYARTGDMEKAVYAMLDAAPAQFGGMEEAKGAMLELLGNDPEKLRIAQKALLRRINGQPENTWFAELLTWLYTQKDDWEGALIQIQAIDERNRENGGRLVDFARTAGREGQYEVAVKTLDAIIEKGPAAPMYTVARAEKLGWQLERISKAPAFSQEEVDALSKAYETFFSEFPQYYQTNVLRDRARLEALYAGRPEQAISLLRQAIEKPGARPLFIGEAKLQLGDYYVLTGKVWDASLMYSQVDKAFREDMLGEEARYRNARLAYYRGDFSWAQGQLNVLKASTSELIANDALNLSVLITENIPPDSNLLPLRRFAYADLLLFQNKDQEAAALLDSLSTAFPEHPLHDDILMLHARLAVKKQDYNRALSYLEQIHQKYGKDVLGDDALYQMAGIYEQYLSQPGRARSMYEQLIIDYPGSTYVQSARRQLQALQQGGTPVPSPTP
jgi:tetratricopeptide (TPR) repeat protein